MVAPLLEIHHIFQQLKELYDTIGVKIVTRKTFEKRMLDLIKKKNSFFASGRWENEEFNGIFHAINCSHVYYEKCRCKLSVEKISFLDFFLRGSHKGTHHSGCY